MRDSTVLFTDQNIRKLRNKSSQMSLHQSRTELIKKAENSEWTLQCDEELLHLIQDVSSVIYIKLKESF